MENCDICDICGFVAQTKKIFSKHKKTHDTGDFSCDKCSKEFTRLQSLWEHKSKVHSTNKFTCSICDKDFLLKNRLKQHEEVHKPKISCPHCMKEIKNLDKHLKTCQKYNKTSKVINVSKCNICNVDCGNLENLRKHVGLYHNILCDDCGKSFTSNRKLNEHKKVSHRDPNECKYCGEKIRSSMNRHIEAKHKVAFGNNYMYVKEKTKKISEGIIRACNVCNKTYTTKKNFNLHMKTVHKEKKTQNSEENKLNNSITLNDSFMSLEDDDEESIDSNLTDFVRKVFFQKEQFDKGCSVCGKMCKDVFTLQRHIAIVHEEKNINVMSVKLHSNNEKNIKRHKDLVHLKNTSFACMQCEKQFSLSSHLKRHLKLLHENTPKQIGRPLKHEKDLSAKQMKRRDIKQVKLIEKELQESSLVRSLTLDILVKKIMRK